MAGGAHPGRPRVRVRVSRTASDGGPDGLPARPRRRRNRMPRLRPLMRRALRLARHVEHLSSDVSDAHAAPWVPHLDERVALARAPKRLGAITRLARVSPGPARGAAPAPAPAPAMPRASVVSVARDVDVAPAFPSAVEVGGPDLGGPDLGGRDLGGRDL